MGKIDKPGVYDISAADYYADPSDEPSLNASIAKLLVNPGGTPLHAWTESPRLNPNFEREEDEKFDLGAAAHSMLLHDVRQFAIIAANDWRTKAAQEERAAARAAGKIPLLAAQAERTLDMVTAARKQLGAHAEGPLFVNGLAEQTIVWDEDGVRCRARLDWRRTDGAPFVPDYKSTGASADPDLWARTMYGMGADMQAAFYLRGVRALRLCDRPEWRFVVQENYEPFALSVIGLTPGALDLADRQVGRALEIWRDCRKRGLWPGYPTRTCFIDAPEWHEARLMARETRENDAETLDAARKAQAPL